MARLFDAYVMVDWSANSTPKKGKDSIWVGAAGALKIEPKDRNPRTRLAAQCVLQHHLQESAPRGLRVLVGFDFAFGFPKGFAAARGYLGADPWKSNWDEVCRRFLGESLNENNFNERFKHAAEWNAEIKPRQAPGPFWGYVTSKTKTHRQDLLQATKPKFPYPDRQSPHSCSLRSCDRINPGTKSVFQLAYAGAVGSQVLLGIPVVESLRVDLEKQGITTKIWPFETDFGGKLPQGPSVVFAEVWPGVLGGSPPVGRVKDDWQVESLAALFARWDVEGTLAQKLAPDLSLELRADALEEGWILGGKASGARKCAAAPPT